MYQCLEKEDIKGHVISPSRTDCLWCKSLKREIKYFPTF